MVFVLLCQNGRQHIGAHDNQIGVVVGHRSVPSFEVVRMACVRVGSAIGGVLGMEYLGGNWTLELGVDHLCFGE